MTLTCPNCGNDRNFQVNVMGLLYLAREVAPDMIKAGNGAILVTGNTSAIRGKANFAGFAPTKASQRILDECLSDAPAHAAFAVKRRGTDDGGVREYAHAQVAQWRSARHRR